MTSYLDELSKRVSRKIGVLMRLKNLIPTSAKLRIYKSFILPQLTYCQTVWHFCRKSDSRKIERLLERALRSVYCDKSSVYEELLIRAKLPSLLNRRLQEIATIMYKVTRYNLCPSYISDIFNLSNRSYNRRDSDNLTIPRILSTTTYGKHSIRYIGPVIWSKLSKHIQHKEFCNRLTSFKNQVRKVDIESLFRTDTCKSCHLCNS